MAINLLYGCCQIETCAHDLGEVRDVMYAQLGAGPMEQELAQEINRIIPGDYGCDHIGLGEAIFQVNRPSLSSLYRGQESVHSKYLGRYGPCVTNLNFFIDDYRHAYDLLVSRGVAVHLEGPSSAARALADYGPVNTRSGADQRPFLFLGTRHLIGFDLEIMEPNFLHFHKQDVQHPAFVHPRPSTGDENTRLERMRVVVPDLHVTWTNLEALFLPASRSHPYAYRVGPSGRSFRVWFGGIEIEYCQPLAKGGDLHVALDRFGPGIVAIDLAARDLEVALMKARGRLMMEPDWLGLGPLPGSLSASFRDPLGFDINFRQAHDDPFEDLSV